MEPIEEWMTAPIISTKKRWRAEDSALDNNRPATQPTSNIDPTWHPEEDCFQVPAELGDELTSVPDTPPRKLLGPDHLAASRASTVEEHRALHAFLNLASASERLGGDNVVLPQHYARFNIEPIRFICENNLNFFQANIVKYILRWDAKNGLEDLRKAQRYLTMFIKFVQKDPDWWRAE